MISSLYGTLYIIINAEDYALLMGSILVFLVLLVLMYVTRKFDWYDLTEPQADHLQAVESSRQK
jgi:inner membrane protein